MIWTPSANQLAQTSHFALAWGAVLTAALFGASWPVCMLVVIFWVIPKEFVFDIYVEGDSYSDGVMDGAWYLVGMFFGLGILWLHHLAI